MERKLRKYQDMLYITGCGVLLLSIWSAIKTAILAVLDTDLFFDIEEVSNAEQISLRTVFVIASIIITIDLLFRIYVFRKASSFARNSEKKGGVFYIIVTCWFVFLSASTIIYYCRPDNALVSLGNTVVTLAFEATSLATYIELIYSAVIVRKLRRDIGRQEN